jgi:hypothetical protein
VHEYREGIEKLLVCIIEKPEEWDAETISSARSFTSLSFDGCKIVSIITCYFNILA